MLAHMNRLQRSVSSLIIPVAGAMIAFGAGRACAQESRPGPAVDYKSLAFYPERWRERSLDMRMVPWKGANVAFLSTTADLDKATMLRFVERLDQGWSLYRELIGDSPKIFRQVDGLPMIAAVPTAELTCGVGCGFVGLTGIEVAGFYSGDYELVKRDRDAFPHYYFYEMGRNFYLFGDRHSAFTTGFAVFMRYVCMDALACKDPDAATRKTIERCEKLYAASKLTFLDAFTNVAGAGEKGHRLTSADGTRHVPSDQPVMYASAMLKLRREYGGDAWVKRFFKALAACPEASPATVKGASSQCLNWLVAASIAAQQDLSPIFCDRWRFEVSPSSRASLKSMDWKDPKLDPKLIIERLAQLK